MRRFRLGCGPLLANLSLLLTFAIFACGNQLIGQSPRFDRASKYYRLREFSIGNLHISNAEVAVVGVLPRLDSNGRETVPLLRLSKAHISFVRKGGTELFTGELDDGTELDPAAELSGKFVWNGSEPHLRELSTLRMRLKQSLVKTDISGSHLRIPSSQSVFLSLRQPITVEPIGGQVVISFSAATLTSVGIDFDGTKFIQDFHSSQQSQAQIDFANEKLVINDATFTATNLSSRIKTHLSSILSEATVESGTVTFSTVKLIFLGDSVRIAGNLGISDPHLTLKAYPNVEVVAVKRVSLPTFSAEIENTIDSFRLKVNPSAAPEYLVQGDSEEVIDRINLSSPFLPDVFLPTAATKIHFVKASAAAEFMRAVGKATDEPKSLRILTIGGANHVVTDVRELSANQSSQIQDQAILHILCGVTIDGYFGSDAKRVLEALLDLPYQSERAPTSPEFRAAYLRLNPKFAPAAATGVINTTDFLTDTRTGEIFSKAPPSSSPQLARLTADVLLGGPASSALVARARTNDNLVLRPADLNKETWKKPENRYLALAVSAEIPDLERPEVTGIIKTPPTATAGSVLRGYPGQYRDPRRLPHKPHGGVDIVANQSSTNKSAYAVHAVDKGTIAYAGWNGACPPPPKIASEPCDPSTQGYGYTIVIDHGNGTYTLYGHLATVASAGVVKVGRGVDAGDIIGFMADPANGEWSSGNALDKRYVSPADRIQLHFEEFEAPPKGNFKDGINKIKNGGRVLDPTPDLVANDYRPAGGGHVALTRDQAGRIQGVYGFERKRRGLLSDASSRQSAVSVIHDEQRQTPRMQPVKGPRISNKLRVSIAPASSRKLTLRSGLGNNNGT
jgi:murein DD-endopeptidase MepM/ murein hydrolase activator NlpD